MISSSKDINPSKMSKENSTTGRINNQPERITSQHFKRPRETSMTTEKKPWHINKKNPDLTPSHHLQPNRYPIVQVHSDSSQHQTSTPLNISSTGVIGKKTDDINNANEEVLIKQNTKQKEKDTLNNKTKVEIREKVKKNSDYTDFTKCNLRDSLRNINGFRNKSNKENIQKQQAKGPKGIISNKDNLRSSSVNDKNFHTSGIHSGSSSAKISENINIVKNLNFQNKKTSIHSGSNKQPTVAVGQNHHSRKRNLTNMGGAGNENNRMNELNNTNDYEEENTDKQVRLKFLGDDKYTNTKERYKKK